MVQIVLTTIIIELVSPNIVYDKAEPANDNKRTFKRRDQYN